MAFWNRRKSLDVSTHIEASRQLKRTLSWPHLIALGVGAIVGTGIYTLTGEASGIAGPAVILSFLIAGAVCACAALAYAEMATMMPAAGSSYTYTYAVGGEILAWIVGWSLILEYTVVCSAVAVGWSGYAAGFLNSVGLHLPASAIAGPYVEGGVINLPAIFISLVVAGALVAGTRESATVNVGLVIVKLVALLVFIALAGSVFYSGNFTPFMPYGFGAHEEGGQNHGVMAAAAIIFFAFYGFDAVSTAAEETKNPNRDLKIGIIGSMILCTVLYMAVAAAALGAMLYTQFAADKEPLALILRTLGHPQAARLIGGAAVLALPTVILAFMYGQSRIFFVMARDGLLPQQMGHVSARTGTPATMTVLTAIVVSVIAGFAPLSKIVAVANAGTLCAFVAVIACMLTLRIREPNRPRVFRAPWPWVVGIVGIPGCIYLFMSLTQFTRTCFFIWNGIGLVVYFLYSMRASRLASQ
jgi:basic amino acid/polyamine antiporter, APA family